MKVAKRYHDLVQMYHFNPIQDTVLFENMETQHFYRRSECYYPRKKEGMTQYIFWYNVNADDIKYAPDDETYKRVEERKTYTKAYNNNYSDDDSYNDFYGYERYSRYDYDDEQTQFIVDMMDGIRDYDGTYL